MQAKKKDFSEWYNEILESAELSDKRYPVKGMNIWLPYGLKAMNLIDAATRRYNEEYGIEEVSFPVLITRNQLEVEFEH
ncbi:MAG: proline--tRNA ligase, partial [Candidatus Thermoplasmatota archaeon]|nr:proline--tRNA ligase [Candidatus Thermoplasmatota archaeon]